VLRSKVLHFQYEELMRNLEPNIRRLLEHCGLPFELACLAFHETRRSVRTASASSASSEPVLSATVLLNDL
jgi:hypothetical protein